MNKQIFSFIILLLTISVFYSQDILFEKNDSIELNLSISSFNDKLVVEFNNHSSKALLIDAYESNNQGNFILYGINEKKDTIRAKVHYRKNGDYFRPNYTGANILFIAPYSKVSLELNLHMCDDSEKCNLFNFFKEKSLTYFFIKYEPRVFNQKITGDLYRDFIVKNMWKGSLNSNALVMNKKTKKSTILCKELHSEHSAIKPSQH